MTNISPMKKKPPASKARRAPVDAGLADAIDELSSRGLDDARWQLVEEYLLKDPEDIEQRRQAVELSLGQNHAMLALSHVLNLIAHSPRDPEPYESLGDVFMALRQPKLAAEAFMRSILAGSGEASVHDKLATAARQAQNSKLAEWAAARSLTLAGDAKEESS